jgi:hypothetical protein
MFSIRKLTPSLIFFLSLATGGSNAFAGVGTSLMQTAETIAPGEFETKAQSDIIFNNGGGFNFSGHIRTGLIEQFLDLDLYAGTGTTNFQVGALGKYNFLPDIDGQIGLSFLGGFSFIRDDIRSANANFYLVTLGGLVSKAIEITQGVLTPYTSLQYEMLWASRLPDKYPWTVLVGSKWLHKNMDPWVFYSEFSFSIHRSVYMFALGAGYPF